jgi:hypothetical protein
MKRRMGKARVMGQNAGDWREEYLDYSGCINRLAAT